jgi:hypothetical protein
VPFFADAVLSASAVLRGGAPVRKLFTHLSQLLQRASQARIARRRTAHASATTSSAPLSRSANVDPHVLALARAAVAAVGLVVRLLVAFSWLRARAVVQAGAADHALGEILVVLRAVNRIDARLVFLQGLAEYTH